jgi:Cu-processing system permease protein
MELTLTWTIALRELRESLRNKWLIAYTVGFALLALALSRASLASAGYAGLGGFGRTAASLVNALLLFVPLLGLSIGASTLAGDHERGTLLYLLAQPVSKAEVFWGKVLGNVIGASLAISVGFGLAAMALASSGSGEPAAYIGLVLFTLLLLLASMGLGFMISSLAHKAATAMGSALLLWLGLAFIGDLTLIGAVLMLRPTPTNLLALLVINPLQIFKLGAIYSLQATLDTLGPAGQYAMFNFGAALPYVLVILLVAWAVITFMIAFWFFNKYRS